MYRKSSPSVHKEIRKISEIYIHEGFNPNSYVNDIAVVRVDRRFYFNAFTSLACLPEEDLNVTPDSKCYAIGWGQLHEASGISAETLQEVSSG